MILIGADMVPTASNADLFSRGDVSTLFGDELCALFQNADYRIINLEMPLTDKVNPIEKSGPCLSAPANTIAAYQAMRIDLAAIANNHIMDQGEEGLRSTWKKLEEFRIQQVGTGCNINEMKKTHVFPHKGKRVAVYACAEKEFSIADDERCGANPFSALDTPDEIAELRRKADYVIVLFHGGKEHYCYPSPQLQRICRKLIEKGADLVICQHSHCIGSMEEYQSGTIVYGQGNFLFDGSDAECWKSGLLVSVDDNGKVGFIPVRKRENIVRLATGEDAETILSDFRERSENLCRPGFVQKSFQTFADLEIAGEMLFMRGIGTRSILYRVMYKLLRPRGLRKAAEIMCGRSYFVRLQNTIRCETHREVVLTGLKGLLDRRR